MMSGTLELSELRRAAREIFAEALRSVDAGAAVRRAVKLRDEQLSILDTVYNLDVPRSHLYAVALGKAALPMAAALNEILGTHLARGVVAGTALSTAEAETNGSKQLHQFSSSRWRVFECGHPTPNQASLAAARAAIDLVKCAERERAPVIFLISGGGSAMMEWPLDASLTLADIRDANRVLVSCGATIAEVNVVRRAFSAIKGGRLAALAPNAKLSSLIVSDTNRGEEWAVASGPTLEPPASVSDAREVVARYKLQTLLPSSIVSVINQAPSERAESSSETWRKHYVLLDNGSAMEAATRAASARGFRVEVARDIIEQPVDEGCAEMLARLQAWRKTQGSAETLCLISGGEFACPVRGKGRGGRNAETALRLAIALDSLKERGFFSTAQGHAVVLSAGTDGVDGNSPAAGATADETTLERARAAGLDARALLEQSDAYAFFDALGDAIMTGPTGTNVRDLRIIVAGSKGERAA